MDRAAYVHTLHIRPSAVKTCPHARVCQTLPVIKITSFRGPRRSCHGVSVTEKYISESFASKSFTMVTQSDVKHRINGYIADRDLLPLRNYILVKFATPEEQTSSGLVIAHSSSHEKATQGTVVAIGEGAFLPKTGGRGPMAIKPGDFILAGKFGGQQVDVDGQKHFLVSQDEILCTLEGGKMEAAAVKPIFDRVLLKKIKAEQETASGIVIAASKELPTVGEVVAVGPGRLLEDGQYEPTGLSVGDHVIYSKYSGNEYRFGGEEYIIVRASDCYAKW
eukprot:jgi/Galph1/5786/GphlegSOOS_G4494.1